MEVAVPVVSELSAVPYNFRREAFHALDACINWNMQVTMFEGVRNEVLVGKHEEWEFLFGFNLKTGTFCGVIINSKRQAMEALLPDIARYWYTLGYKKLVGLRA